MTSNRPTNENQLVLSCTEETCASSAAELQTEQSVSAAMEKSALATGPRCAKLACDTASGIAI